MAVVVLIPTFQRPETLQWSLQSVLRQETSRIDSKEELRVVILNNDTSTKHLVEDSVDSALRSAGKRGFREVLIVHRDPPVLGVINFCRGLAENTQDGDIAFIHGDDDIMLQGSLAKRWLVARESSSALNICMTKGGVFFSEKTRISMLISEKQLMSSICCLVGDGRPKMT